jgi:vacuolar-type H+-ATPase subunit E/Vma4
MHDITGRQYKRKVFPEKKSDEPIRWGKRELEREREEAKARAASNAERYHKKSELEKREAVKERAAVQQVRAEKRYKRALAAVANIEDFGTVGAGFEQDMAARAYYYARSNLYAALGLPLSLMDEPWEAMPAAPPAPGIAPLSMRA